MVNGHGDEPGCPSPIHKLIHCTQSSPNSICTLIVVVENQTHPSNTVAASGTRNTYIEYRRMHLKTDWKDIPYTKPILVGQFFLVIISCRLNKFCTRAFIQYLSAAFHFFCLYPISFRRFQLRDQRQMKGSLCANKFVSGKPALVGTFIHKCTTFGLHIK